MENRHHLRQRAVVTDVAGEDHERHPDRLGGGVERPEHRDRPGEQLAGHLRAADPQPTAHHVVRGDAALGDHPGGPGGQCVADDPGQGRRHGAGDREAARRVGGRHDRAAGVQQHVRVTQGRGDPPRGTGHHRAGHHRGGGHVRAAGQYRGHVELDVRGDGACPERGHLPAGLPDMRADHDQAVPARPGPHSPVRSPDLRTAQGRLGPQAAQRPHERRPGAEQERLSLTLGVQHGAGHRLQVGVLGGVHHHPRPARRAGQYLAHPARPAEPDIREADAVHILRLDRPPAFFRNENPQVRSAIPERSVLREFGFTDRDQPGGRASPVDIGRGHPACLQERRNQQHAVIAAADHVPPDRLQRGDLRHHVAAQRGVAPADQLDAGPAPSRHRDQASGGPGGQLGGGRPAQAAGVGQHETRGARPGQRRGVGVFLQHGHDLDVMHGLRSGRIVVEDPQEQVTGRPGGADRFAETLVAGAGRRQPGKHLGRVRPPVPQHPGPLLAPAVSGIRVPSPRRVHGRVRQMRPPDPGSGSRHGHQHCLRSHCIPDPRAGRRRRGERGDYRWGRVPRLPAGPGPARRRLDRRSGRRGPAAGPGNPPRPGPSAAGPGGRPAGCGGRGRAGRPGGPRAGRAGGAGRRRCGLPPGRRGQRGVRGRLRPGYPGEPARHRGAAGRLPRGGHQPAGGLLQFDRGVRRVSRAAAPGRGAGRHAAEPADQLRDPEVHRRAVGGRLHPQGVLARAEHPADDGQRASRPAQRRRLGLHVGHHPRAARGPARGLPGRSGRRGGAGRPGPGHRGAAVRPLVAGRGVGRPYRGDHARPHGDGRGHGRRAGAGGRPRGDQPHRLGPGPGGGGNGVGLGLPFPLGPGGRPGPDRRPRLHLDHPPAPGRDPPRLTPQPPGQTARHRSGLT